MKKYGKTNDFAKLCRPQKVNAVKEEFETSEPDCHQVEDFEDCDDFELLSTEKLWGLCPKPDDE